MWAHSRRESARETRLDRVSEVLRDRLRSRGVLLGVSGGWRLCDAAIKCDGYHSCPVE